MRVEIKYIFSPDIHTDNKFIEMNEFIPKEPDCFGIRVSMIIGPKGEEGGESFDFMLVSPQWLMSNKKNNEFIIGRHYLIAFEYNYERLMIKLRELIEDYEYADWNEVGIRVGRIGHWEFEDYIDTSAK